MAQTPVPATMDPAWLQWEPCTGMLAQGGIHAWCRRCCATWSHPMHRWQDHVCADILAARAGCSTPALHAADRCACVTWPLWPYPVPTTPLAVPGGGDHHGRSV